jgi:hypothetical protein
MPSNGQSIGVKIMATFRAPSNRQWEPIIDGAAFSSFGLQCCGKRVDVYIGASVPDAKAEDFIILSRDITREITADLASNEKVYIRSEGTLQTGVRGFRKARA